MAAFIGTAQALVLVLLYVVLVQVLMSATLLLGQFAVLQLRKLMLMIGEPQKPKEPEQPPYRVGGGLLKW